MGIHYRRKSDFFPEENTSMPYSGFEPKPTRLQAEGHIHHTGWAAWKHLISLCGHPKCLSGSPVDRDRRNAQPRFKENWTLAYILSTSKESGSSCPS
ncbi:hypothetical protein TNCV_1598601 [Trichonephila clavipes]|nr:hypothetical protein TNCV_1598601 [Trichonephila clavipes]